MRYPIDRLLILSLFLCLGLVVVIAIPAGAEPSSLSVSGPRAGTDTGASPSNDGPPAQVEAPPFTLASLGDSPDALSIELGLVPVKPQEPASVTAPVEPAMPESAGPDPRPEPEVRPFPLAPGAGAKPPPAPARQVAAAPPSAHERPEVRFFLDRFQTGYRRAVVEQWLTRAGRYGGMIRDILVEKGLPEELVFTAMIESGFNPVAVSRVGAKGLWQFMAATARRYGLRVDRWMDERLDPEKSTIAAAAYLRDLYAMFGSWPLVQAAYNAGEMRVARAIQGMGSTDFWQLTRSPLLSDETKNFVASIQAISLIGRAPDRYGFMVTPADPLRYETVQVPAGTSLKRLAAQSGVEESALQGLNTELRLGQTPPGKPYAIKVPVGTSPQVHVALGRDPSHAQTVASRPSVPAGHRERVARPPARAYHVVKAQETVGSIAKRYGVTPTDIARWNRLSEADRIRPGDRLRVASLTRAEREDGQGGFR